MGRDVLLSHGFVALIDDDDWERSLPVHFVGGATADIVISEYTWQAHIGKRYRFPYARTFMRPDRGSGIRGILLHRAITGAKPGQLVDHINGNTLDNRKSNIRICSARQNMQNSGRHNGASQFKGVCRSRRNSRRWMAKIRIENTQVVLGYFDEEADAARAYDAAAVAHYGEFARLNF